MTPGADPLDPMLARVVAAVSRAAPSLQPQADPEPLLDALADRLEAAAAELGIAMGERCPPR